MRKIVAIKGYFVGVGGAHSLIPVETRCYTDFDVVDRGGF